MSALRRIVAATMMAGALSASVLLSGPAFADESMTFHGTGLSSNYYTALFNAQNQARSLASAAGFEPYSQCSPGVNFVTQPFPGVYSVRAQLICVR